MGEGGTTVTEKRMVPTRVVRVQGSPAERGFRHGRELAEPIGRFYDRYMAEATRTKPDATGKTIEPLSERDLVSFAWSHLPESRAFAPDLVEECEAIASGAGVAFEKVWFLNCFDEAGNYRQYRKQNAAGERCTTFAATGRSTVGGVTYIAQNWDISYWYDCVILEILPGGGEIGAYVYTHPGIVGGSGVNAAGVALVWNSLHPNDCRTGLPCTFLVRKALQRDTLPLAIQATVDGVRAIGFNFILGADFGAVNVEATATRHKLRYVSTHYGHANHYDEPEQAAYEANPSKVMMSFVKGGRMSQVLDELAPRIDLEACKRILSDHACHPGSICVHHDPAHNRPDSHSQSALIYVPAAGLMLSTNGPACENPFQEFRTAALTRELVAR